MSMERFILVLMLSLSISCVAHFTGILAADAVPDNSLSIEHYGAIPNDNQDDREAIVKCMEAAKAKGKSVYIPKGVYHYAKTFEINGITFLGEGPESVLKALVPAQMAVWLNGKGTVIKSVKFTTDNPPPRNNRDAECAGIYICKEATDYTIDGIYLEKSMTVGIFCQGSNGVIKNSTIKNTNADGIHVTNAPSNVIIENNIIEDNGDDCIALVGYKSYKQPIQNITIRNNKCSRGLGSRGITVIGAKNVLVENNRCNDIPAAGLYVAAEGNYNTFGNEDIIIRNNEVNNPSKIDGTIYKGGIRVEGGNDTYPSIKNLVFSHNKVTNSKCDGIFITGSKGVEAKFDNNIIEGSQNYGVYIAPGTTGNIEFTQNSITGSAKDELKCESNLITVKVDDKIVNEAGNGGQGAADDVAVKGTPVIDGKIDDVWNKASTFQMSKNQFGVTGTCKMLWDERSMYFLVVVQDQSQFAKVGKENIKDQNGNDSVEFWVDEKNLKTGAINETTYHVRVDINNLVGGNWGYPYEKVQSEVVREQDFYLMEVAVPFIGITPGEGKTLGLNVSANDDHSGDGHRDGYISWVEPSLPYWSDQGVFKNVELVLENKIKPAMAETFKSAVLLFVDRSEAYIHNRKVKIDASNEKVVPIVDKGRTLVPLRFISESLDARVEWDEDARGITVASGGAVIKFILNDTAYTVNGVEKELEVAPQTINDRAMIPFRALAEALGKSVFWDDRGLVIITEGVNVINKDSDKAIVDEAVNSFTK